MSPILVLCCLVVKFQKFLFQEFHEKRKFLSLSTVVRFYLKIYSEVLSFPLKHNFQLNSFCKVCQI